MKNTTLISLAALVVASVVACSGKKAPAAAQTGAADDASTPASNGDASWSATIDGAAVTGIGVDQLQQQNAAYLLPTGSPKQHLVFFLFSTKNGADQSANTSLRFWIPPAVGTYTQKGSTEHSCDCSMTLNQGIASDQELARYGSDSVTITVTSMTATRVAGTFSGTFKLGPDTPRATKKSAKVIDGKFDIPMSTSKVTPE